MINGRALFVGVFLAAGGTVMLVGQGDAVARDAIASALRLWPLAVIALGAGLILRRTRLNLAGAVVAALVPGLLFGGIVLARMRALIACSSNPCRSRTSETTAVYSRSRRMRNDSSCRPAVSPSGRRSPSGGMMIPLSSLADVDASLAPEAVRQLAGDGQ